MVPGRALEFTRAAQRSRDSEVEASAQGRQLGEASACELKSVQTPTLEFLAESIGQIKH